MGGSHSSAETSAELHGNEWRVQLLPHRLVPAQRPGHREPHARAQRHPRHHAPEQGLRPALVRARRRQPRELHLRKRGQQVPDPERARPGAVVHARGRAADRFQPARREAEREELLPGAHLPALGRREPRLPDLALPSLHGRDVPPRSRGRPRLQRRGRADPAAQRRRGLAGRRELSPGQPAHAAHGLVREPRALHGEQRFHRLSGRRRRQPDERRAGHDPGRQPDRGQSVRHLPAGRVASDARADGELRLARRPCRYSGQRGPGEPAVGPGLRPVGQDPHPRRLRALLHAAADREDRHHLGRALPGHDQRAAVGCEHGGEVRALQLLRRRRLAPAHAVQSRWAWTATTATCATCRTRASSATR